MNFPLFIARRIYFSEGDRHEVSRPAIRIATVGVAIGLAVMIITVSVILGFKHTIRDKMVGFGITFPSFSRALQKTRDGRFLPFGWWHLLKILKWHKTPIVDLLLIGVLPEYRSKGANALIFDDLIRQFQRYGFEWAETGPQMETNEGVLSQWQYLESKVVRRHRCYRKELK